MNAQRLLAAVALAFSLILASAVPARAVPPSFPRPTPTASQLCKLFFPNEPATDQTKLTKELADAIGMRSLPNVQAALVKGADPNARDSYGITMLFHATGQGRAPIVQLLICAGADVNARHGTTGETALHHASAFGMLAIVGALLAAGADPDIGDNEGFTPLHRAAHFHRTEVVRRLIAVGADVNTRSSPQWNAGESVLGAALKGQDGDPADIVQLLINAGAKIDRPDGLGMTPMHWAAHRGHAESIKLLAAKGAEVNVYSQWNGTPLMEAAAFGSLASVEALLDAGANAAAVNDYGQTALSLAEQNNHTAVAERIRQWFNV
ncbi:MAG: palmitoyltransferase Hip14 isoform [Symbiobacteriaceae bacterium]|jgi:ankyrin repeat protein|nr:palmitoyltransferase Hip14 isoform [Symbiobacteriaceae bacterium]